MVHDIEDYDLLSLPVIGHKLNNKFGWFSAGEGL